MINHEYNKDIKKDLIIKASEDSDNVFFITIKKINEIFFCRRIS